MKRVLLIFPHLTSYLLPLIVKLADSQKATFDVVHSSIPSGMGFGGHLPFEHPNLRWFELPLRRIFGNVSGMYQSGILSHIYHTHPDIILTWSNPRFLSFWGVLIMGRTMAIPVYARGHGLFKKRAHSILHRNMYKLILALTEKYICYTPAVKESLLPLTKNEAKLVVDYNTLHNDFPILSDTRNGKESGIFYIGRIRPGCGVDLLIESVNKLNQEENMAVELHVVGDGPVRSFVQREAGKYPWLHYYGAVYDQKRIREIAQECRFGCGPGFMGLNVVHMFSLSLPVVTHGRLKQHMGPEPEYIQHKLNGWLLEGEISTQSLKDTLQTLWRMPAGELKHMQESAFRSYMQLGEPPFHERLLAILEL